MSEPQRSKPKSNWRQQVGELALDSHGAVKESLLKPVIKTAPKAVGHALRATYKGPAAVYDLAKIARAEDKGREAAGVLGSIVGGSLGGLAGTALGGVSAPVGIVAGGLAGEELATDFYDAHEAWIDGNAAKVGRAVDRWMDANRRKADATRKWIDGRNRQLRRR